MNPAASHLASRSALTENCFLKLQKCYLHLEIASFYVVSFLPLTPIGKNHSKRSSPMETCSVSNTQIPGASLVVQWLRFCAPSAGGMGSIPGQGTKIPHAAAKKKPPKKHQKKC